MESSVRRVVVTGMGLISPLGCSVEQVWESLATESSGVEPLQSLPTSDLPTKVGGEAREFTGEIDQFGPLEKTLKRRIKKGLKLMCREIEMSVASSQLALANAGLEHGKFDPDRIGTLFGSDYILTMPHEFAPRAC